MREELIVKVEERRWKREDRREDGRGKAEEVMIPGEKDLGGCRWKSRRYS